VSSLWRRAQEPATLASAAAVAVIAQALPLGALGLEIASSASQSASLLRSGALWGLLLETVARALAVVGLAVVIGLPLGFLLGRSDVVGRRWAVGAHVFPLFVPPFLLALGWFYLFGRQGLVGSERTSRLVFSDAGAIFVQAFAFTPVVTALTMLGLDAVDPSLEEAASTAASRWRVASRISLPLIWPNLALAALIVFALSLAELGVPMFLRVKSFPAVVFARLGGISYSPGEAFILTVPLAMVALVVLVLERFIARKPVAMTRLRRGRTELELGPARWPLTLACWGFVVLTLAPLVALGVRAAKGGGFALVPAWIGRSLGNSIVSAIIAATFIVMVGAVQGWMLARRKSGARLLDGLMALSFVMPAAALGVGLIAVWNRAETGFLYSSGAILVIGYVARYLIIGARPIAAAVAQTSVTFEDAAAALGAGFVRRFGAIVLPAHGRALVSAWLLAAVFCLRDLETAVLYYPPGGETLPVRIFTLEANGPEPVVAALAVLHVCVTATVLGAGTLLLRRKWR
jgi:iron(III) transport system permease protein